MFLTCLFRVEPTLIELHDIQSEKIVNYIQLLPIEIIQRISFWGKHLSPLPLLRSQTTLDPPPLPVPAGRDFLILMIL